MRRGIMHFATAFAAIAIGVLAGQTTRADTFAFGFENYQATSPPHTGALTIVFLTNATHNVIITRPGSSFDIVDNSGAQAKPPEFGQRSLDPFSDVSNTPFIINFSSAVDGVSIDMGDYGEDIDTLIIEAYSEMDAMGVLVASSTFVLAPGPSFSYATLSVFASHIRSVRFIGGSPASPNSVFYDNLTVTNNAIPEPATLLLLGTGLMGIAASVKSRRRRGAPTEEKAR